MCGAASSVPGKASEGKDQRLAARNGRRRAAGADRSGQDRSLLTFHQRNPARADRGAAMTAAAGRGIACDGHTSAAGWHVTLTTGGAGHSSTVTPGVTG